MPSIQDLFTHNRAWAAEMERERPGFFTNLKSQQTPKYMWIGCSDSRVPANQITGLEPGEVFVHRNVANVVVPSDLNALSVIQFAVEHLRVEHIMVVGHYGCGGVIAAARGTRIGLVDNWLRHVADVHDKHHESLEKLDAAQRVKTLCELNVIEQVLNVCQSTVLQDAWSRGQSLQVHAWIYSLHDGRIQALNQGIEGPDTVIGGYRRAVSECWENINV